VGLFPPHQYENRKRNYTSRSLLTLSVRQINECVGTGTDVGVREFNSIYLKEFFLPNVRDTRFSVSNIFRGRHVYMYTHYT